MQIQPFQISYFEFQILQIYLKSKIFIKKKPLNDILLHTKAYKNLKAIDLVNTPKIFKHPIKTWFSIKDILFTICVILKYLKQAII